MKPTFKTFQPNNLGLIRPLADKSFTPSSSSPASRGRKEVGAGTMETFETIGTSKLSRRDQNRTRSAKEKLSRR